MSTASATRRTAPTRPLAAAPSAASVAVVARRPLGYGEMLWWRISEAGSNNAVILGEIEGAVEVERLRWAIERVVHAFPLLRARVERGPDGHPQFCVQATLPQLPLRIVARTTDGQWIDEAEDELVRAVPHDANPLWRMVLLRGDDRSELLFTFNHAIGDGQSGTTVINEVLKHCAGMSDVIAPMALPPGYDDVLKPVSRGRVLAGGVRQLLRQMRAGVEAGLPVRAGVPGDAPAVTRLIDTGLDEATSSRLAQRCREQGVTVHAVLGSAFLLAMNEVAGGGTRGLSLTSAVSVRPLLQGDFERDVGYFVTGIDGRFKVGNHTGLWALARQAQADTRRQFTPEAVAFGLWMRRLALAIKKTGQSLVEAAPRGSKASIHLTNMGRLSFDGRYDGPHAQLRLRRCFHIASVQLVRRPFVCLASISFAGRLQLTFSYCAPMTDRALVESLVARMTARLREVAAEAGQPATP